MIGANDGNIYRGNPSCDGGEGYSIYRTRNGGLTWTEHRLPTETTGKADTWNAEEAQVHPDEENNLHAMWNGLDNMPYYSYSRDEGDTWSEPLMIAPPAGLVGTGFPAVAAGAEGRDEGYWRVLEELGGRDNRAALEDFLRLCAQYARDLFVMGCGREGGVVQEIGRAHV